MNAQSLNAPQGRPYRLFHPPGARTVQAVAAVVMAMAVFYATLGLLRGDVWTPVVVFPLVTAFAVLLAMNEPVRRQRVLSAPGAAALAGLARERVPPGHKASVVAWGGAYGYTAYVRTLGTDTLVNVSRYEQDLLHALRQVMQGAGPGFTAEGVHYLSNGSVVWRYGEGFVCGPQVQGLVQLQDDEEEPGFLEMWRRARRGELFAPQEEVRQAVAALGAPEAYWQVEEL